MVETQKRGRHTVGPEQLMGAGAFLYRGQAAFPSIRLLAATYWRKRCNTAFASVTAELFTEFAMRRHPAHAGERNALLSEEMWR